MSNQLQKLRRARVFIPKPARKFFKGLVSKVAPSIFKHGEELDYWAVQWREGRFGNNWYKDILLNMAGERDGSFLRGKVVADFGCGPLGSLCWADQARARIGIDVLAEQYVPFRTNEHDMIYVISSERAIPLPSQSIDVLFTLNAMDHVVRFGTICDEIARVLKPGGYFFGSFNLNQPPTFSEPQTLTKDKVLAHLRNGLHVLKYNIFPPGPKGELYKNFADGSMQDTGVESFLWVTATKEAS